MINLTYSFRGLSVLSGHRTPNFALHILYIMNQYYQEFKAIIVYTTQDSSLG